MQGRAWSALDKKEDSAHKQNQKRTSPNVVGSMRGETPGGAITGICLSFPLKDYYLPPENHGGVELSCVTAKQTSAAARQIRTPPEVDADPMETARPTTGPARHPPRRRRRRSCGPNGTSRPSRLRQGSGNDFAGRKTRKSQGPR